MAFFDSSILYNPSSSQTVYAEKNDEFQTGPSVWETTAGRPPSVRRFWGVGGEGPWDLWGASRGGGKSAGAAEAEQLGEETVALKKNTFGGT